MFFTPGRIQFEVRLVYAGQFVPQITGLAARPLVAHGLGNRGPQKQDPQVRRRLARRPELLGDVLLIQLPFGVSIAELVEAASLLAGESESPETPAILSKFFAMSNRDAVERPLNCRA